ncbi:MAG: MFS transporter [Candidatus Eremiobacteraeota bacterium]|nr:MFS transporter [Candidatus Eremiobacteraeota bacterium]
MKPSAPLAARERWTLLATIVGSSLVFIDGSVVGLALPTIQRTFHASAADVQWIVEGYALALAALMLFGGALGDRYGRRRIFQIGIALFAVASLACALAPSIQFLIAARVVQGIGGMLLAPASLAIIGACFEGAKRDRAYASWSAYGALTSAIGPALGGVLIDHFGWRSVFYINLPLAALVLWATFAHIGESRDEDIKGGLDVLGATLATVGLGGLTYAMISSTEFGWGSARVIAALAIAVVSLAAFVPVEARAAAPIMPLSLFRNRSFAGVNAQTLLLYGITSLFYFLPFDMIQAHGYSATAAAIATLPLIGGLVLLARVGTSLMGRIGARAILFIGPIIAGIGCALLGIFEGGGTYWTSFFPGLLVVGIGMGLTVAPLTATVMSSADPRFIGSASGINNAVARMAGLLAIAGLGALVWFTFNTRLDAALAASQATPAQIRAVAVERPKMGATMIVDPTLHADILDAYRAGFKNATYASALLALLAAIVGWSTIRGRESGRAQ